MCLIPCSENCIYQTEGYCNLDTPGSVTNSKGNGCIHFVRREELPRQPKKTAGASGTAALQ